MAPKPGKTILKTLIVLDPGTWNWKSATQDVRYAMYRELAAKLALALELEDES